MPAGFDPMPEAKYMSAVVLANLLRDNPIVITGTGSFSAAGGSVEALCQARALQACRVRFKWRTKVRSRISNSTTTPIENRAVGAINSPDRAAPPEPSHG